MAIPLKELLKMSSDEIAALFPEQKCTQCPGRIDEHPDEQYPISGKPACSDCYFNALGDEIEKHPIYNLSDS